MVLDRRKTVVLDSLRRFLRRGAHGHLLNLLAKSRPPDFPPIFDAMTEREQQQLFKLFADRGAELGASFLVELQLSQQVDLAQQLPAEAIGKLLGKCSGDDAARVLAELEEERSNEVLRLMQPEDKAAVEKLLIYEEETAGRIMTPEVFALVEERTVGEAVAAVQARGDDVEMVFYLYVVDERSHLVGVISLRELLVHPPHMQLKDFMNHDLITVRTDADQEEVARIASKYDLLAVPVVDDRGRLVGMITIDDVVDVLRDEATEDIYQMAGTRADERLEPSILKSTRARYPWLLAAYVGGMLAMLVIRQFDLVLSEVVALAALLPVVIGVGGAAGNQSATVIIRGLATGRVERGRYMGHVGREIGVAGLLGTIYGFLVGLGTYAYAMIVGSEGLVSEAASGRFGSVALAVVCGLIGLSLTLSLIVSTAMGAMIPLALDRAGVDPAVSTTPFVTTATDVAGSAIFFLLVSSILAT